MKKVMAIVLATAMGLSIPACGGEGTPNKNEAQSEKKEGVKTTETPSNLEDGFEKVESIDIESEKSTLKYEKYEITMGDSEQNAIILYFDFTNINSDKTNIRADFDVSIYQNGVSCSPLLTTRESEPIENENKNVLKGGNVKVGLLYELQDLESPIKIRVNNTSRGEDVEVFYQQQELDITQQ